MGRGRSKANGAANSVIKASALPELTGSEKQVKWATTLRESFMKNVEDLQRLHRKEYVDGIRLSSDERSAAISGRSWLEHFVGEYHLGLQRLYDVRDEIASRHRGKYKRVSEAGAAIKKDMDVFLFKAANEILQSKKTSTFWIDTR